MDHAPPLAWDNRKFGGSELPKMKRRCTQGSGMVVSNIWLKLTRGHSLWLWLRPVWAWPGDSSGSGETVAGTGTTRSRELFIGASVRPVDLGLSGMYSSLSSSGPVKWHHNQETSLFQDVSPFSPAYDGRSTATLGEKVRELYLQFLWLPEVRVCCRSVCSFKHALFSLSCH
jgi:hypothetical protein